MCPFHKTQLRIVRVVDTGCTEIAKSKRWGVVRGGALVDSSPFVRRVVGANPSRRDLGQVFHSQLPVHGASASNSDTVSVLRREHL